MVEGDPVGLPDFGPYQVRELLGQGGMGVVHRAYDTVNDRVVALKRLSGADREYQVRFRRESRIVAGLRHPNVIPVNDFGEIDGRLYLDMMLVEGVDLRRALGSGSMDQDTVLGILAQVADALDAAHAMGLVHRDVKPSNVLLDGAGHAYLADFGIARETSPEVTALTASGDLIGSWDYLAPERLSGGPVDGRADQYSLACVLFECLTGRLPYPAIDTAAKVAAHLLQPAPAPSLFVPTITPALDAVVLRGLAKAPGRRFATSSALIAAARSAAYAGSTVRSAAHTAPGPSKERDQGRLVRAIVRSTAVRKPPTLVIPHDRPPTCPYPGLSGFDQDDGDLFHGRDHVVTDLLVRLAEQLDGGEPVVLVGASGAGKSSVLHAGLLPALALGDGPGQGGWPLVVLTPGRDPIVNLATALAEHSDIVAAEWVRVIREKPAEFGSVCARALGADRVRPVIVVDQFEELFTHGTSEADRLAFATALANASPALVVLAVRADLVDRCIDLAPLLPALTSPVLLGAMDATELRQAIVSPARDSGIDVEPGLPERLIADLGVRGEIGYDPGALPRLAHALREAWNYRDGEVLTLAAYRRAGGIDGAVSRTAEEIHGGLDDSGRRTLRTIMLRLVTVSDDGGVARRRVDPHEVAAEADQGGIVDALIAARLVTVDGSGARLSHEALLTAWPRLRDWIDEDRAGLVQHRRFSDSVRAWHESGRHEDDLYRGVRLAALTSWLDSAADRVRLNPAEQEFLTRSTEAERAGHLAARRRTTRLRGMVTALSLLLVVAGIAGVVAYRLGQDARAERDRADAGKQQNLSRQLAAESALARGVDPRRAALAALGAWQASPTLEARSAVLANATDGYRGRMTGHDGAIWSIVMSDDGQVAVTGGRDGSLRLWDVPSRRQLAVLSDGDGWYRKVSMRADGKVVAAADVLGNKVELWSVPDRTLIATLPMPAVDTALSPDGRTIAANVGSSVVVLDTTTFAEISRFPISTTLAMSFNSDGTLIATNAGNNAEVHRASDGGLVATLAGHTDAVNRVEFDRAGTTLATASSDSTVRLWDTTSWTTRRTLETGDVTVNALAFNAQGTALVSGGINTSVSIWNPTTGDLLLRYSTGATTVLGLAMSGDGHTLLGADIAGVVRKWSYGRTIVGGHVVPVTGAAFQSKGKLLATVSGDGVVRLWDSTTGDLVKQMPGHAKSASDVAFSPDGTLVATAGDDGAVIVWTVADGTEARRFTTPGAEFAAVAFSPDGATIAASSRSTEEEADHDEIVLLKTADLSVVARRGTRDEPRNVAQNGLYLNYPNSVAFSPDGRTLAATLSAGKVVLWSMVDPGAALTTLAGHDGTGLAAEFSPDGTVLATSGGDRLVRLWRVRDGQQVGEFAGSDSSVRGLAFSPDGKTLATASQDTVLRVWDVASRQPVARLDRHDNDLNDVAFDASGEHVATASGDGTAHIWDLVPEHAVEVLCGLLDRDTLADEWRALGPDRGDPPNCSN